jgi:hypothetical protein
MATLKTPKAKSQVERMWELLSDGKAHRTDEIVERVYGDGLALARVAARVWDVKQRYKVEIAAWKCPNRTTLHWYQIKGE